MINLIKYEFIKKGKLFGIAFVSAILVDLFVCYKYDEVGLGIYLGFLAIAMFLLYAVDIVTMYSKDLNNKSGYMIFMTPNSGYTIIGSKVITSIIEGIGMIIFYLLLTLLSFSIVSGFENIFNSDLIHYDVSYGFTIGHLIIILFIALLLSVQFILTIYTAITIRKSLLSNIKFKGLISFIIFIVLNVIIVRISESFENFAAIFREDIITNTGLISAGKFLVNALPTALLISIICIVLTLFSGFLLEKKINL